MKKNEKSSLIAVVQAVLAESNGIFVVENNGLTVRETESLRNELRPISKMFRVVKNRLMKRALDGGQFAGVSEFLKKPTAVVLADDPYACAKAIYNFAEQHPKFAIIGGQMDAGVMDAAAVIEIAKMPSLLEIRGTIARILVEPGSRLARVTAEYGKKN